MKTIDTSFYKATFLFFQPFMRKTKAPSHFWENFGKSNPPPFIKEQGPTK